MRRWILVATTVMLSACSTQPSISTNTATPLVANQITADNSVVVVRRDVGMMGSACPIDVYLDGEKYARLQSGESVAINTTANTHILSGKFTGKGFCQDRLVETEVRVGSNETKYYRLYIGANADFQILPTLKNPIR